MKRGAEAKEPTAFQSLRGRQMYSVHDILTGIGETSEFDALRQVVRSVLYPQESKVIVLDEEARRRALQKRLERQQVLPRTFATGLGTAS